MAKSVFHSRISYTNTRAVFPIERFPYRRFQLSKFCIYGHKISQGYSIMTDNLKRAGIFLRCPFLTFKCRIPRGVFVDEL